MTHDRHFLEIKLEHSRNYKGWRCSRCLEKEDALFYGTVFDCGLPEPKAYALCLDCMVQLDKFLGYKGKADE